MRRKSLWNICSLMLLKWDTKRANLLKIVHCSLTWLHHRSSLPGPPLNSQRGQVGRKVACSVQCSRQRIPCRGCIFPALDPLSRLQRSSQELKQISHKCPNTPPRSPAALQTQSVAGPDCTPSWQPACCECLKGRWDEATLAQGWAADTALRRKSRARSSIRGCCTLAKNYASLISEKHVR